MRKKSKVYLSTSIQGHNPIPHIASRVVNFLEKNNCVVLDKQVVMESKEEREDVFFHLTGIKLSNLDEESKKQVIRKFDSRWVDEASIVIVLISGPSHGVGMEIERALLKPERGLEKTQIYCFVSEEYFEKLSAMISGIHSDNFHLRSFSDFNSIKQQLHLFLM